MTIFLPRNLRRPPLLEIRKKSKNPKKQQGLIKNFRYLCITRILFVLATLKLYLLFDTLNAKLTYIEMYLV